MKQKSNWGQKFKRTRIARGVTFLEAADRSGIGKGALSKLESGKNCNPTIGTLESVFAVVGQAITIKEKP